MYAYICAYTQIKIKFLKKSDLALGKGMTTTQWSPPCYFSRTGYLKWGNIYWRDIHLVQGICKKIVHLSLLAESTQKSIYSTLCAAVTAISGRLKYQVLLHMSVEIRKVLHLWKLHLEFHCRWVFFLFKGTAFTTLDSLFCLFLHQHFYQLSHLKS